MVRESGLNDGLGLEPGRGTCLIVAVLGVIWRESLRCLGMELRFLGLERSVRGAELDFGRLVGVDAAGGTEARRTLLV